MLLETVNSNLWIEKSLLIDGNTSVPLIAIVLLTKNKTLFVTFETQKMISARKQFWEETNMIRALHMIEYYCCTMSVLIK